MASKNKSSGTALIIDDNEGNRELCRICLEAKDFLVHTAINGKQGLEALRQIRPDVVLLDLMMPVMNGFQVLEHLKADPMIQDTPVLVQSASTDTTTVVKALEMGANDFLKKPFEVDELVIRVKKLINCKQTRDSLIEASIELVKRQHAIDEALEKWSLEAEAFRKQCEKSVINILSESNAAFKLEQAISSSQHARRLINRIIDQSRQQLPEYNVLN
jgi:DNA-binding response OmpR family regulator